MKTAADETLNCCQTPTENGSGGKNLEALNECELLERIDALGFAAYDLQLFLDTHRDCEEALALYKNLVFSYRAAKKLYETKFFPLAAMNSSEKTPFEWVADEYVWPWQKEGEL